MEISLGHCSDAWAFTLHLLLLFLSALHLHYSLPLMVVLGLSYSEVSLSCNIAGCNISPSLPFSHSKAEMHTSQEALVEASDDFSRSLPDHTLQVKSQTFFSFPCHVREASVTGQGRVTKLLWQVFLCFPFPGLLYFLELPADSSSLVFSWRFQDLTHSLYATSQFICHASQSMAVSEKEQLGSTVRTLVTCS